MRGLLMRFGRLAVIVGCCGIMLAACGKKDQDAASSGQVVAHVGDQVVTTQEFENELRHANIAPDKQKDPELIKRVLSELVIRKYILQQASPQNSIASRACYWISCGLANRSWRMRF